VLNENYSLSRNRYLTSCLFYFNFSIYICIY